MTLSIRTWTTLSLAQRFAFPYRGCWYHFRKPESVDPMWEHQGRACRTPNPRLVPRDLSLLPGSERTWCGMRWAFFFSFFNVGCLTFDKRQVTNTHVCQCPRPNPRIHHAVCILSTSSRHNRWPTQAKGRRHPQTHAVAIEKFDLQGPI